MKIKYLLPVIALLTSCMPQGMKTISYWATKGKWIDLTYDFSNKTIYWPNNPEGFKLDTQFNGITERGFYYSSNQFFSPEHGGTHLDAPIHFAAGKWTNDQIPIERLMGDAIVLDISAQAKEDIDYQITIQDLLNWERLHGKIPENAILFFKTGWGNYYPEKSKYIGTDGKGAAAIARLHFPSIHPDLADWLVKNRKIKAVGIDTASIDYGQSKDFKTHQILLGQNILGFENVANLDKLPPKGAFVIALPMKIKNGTGGPLRLVAWIKS